MRILVFRQEDFKADRITLKKKNNARELSKEEFKAYIQTNNLSVSYGYMDSRGNISNGEIFKCYLKIKIRNWQSLTDIGTHIPVGVSNLVKEINNQVKP
jgi:hypothetical protein